MIITVVVIGVIEQVVGAIGADVDDDEPTFEEDVDEEDELVEDDDSMIELVGFINICF